MKQFAQIVYRRLRATSAFSPVRLFANGEVGAWYDPSDMTTLFQDVAGTTPVTAVEQPVGLMLDKSQGAGYASGAFSGLGAELAVNGAFTTDTAWTKGANWAITGGQAVYSGASTDLLQQNMGLVQGRTYQITLTSSAAVNLRLGDTGASSNNINGTQTILAVCTGTSGILSIRPPLAPVTIDNISVRELPGNHATQSTSASRPVLSARVNLLTYTEQFDNAAWSRTELTVASDQTSAPDGTSTADLLAETAISNSHQIFPTVSMTTGVAYTAVFHLKKGPGSTAPNWARLAFRSGAMTTAPWANFNISTGVVGNTSGAGITASITGLPNGWYRCAVTATADATSANGGGYVQLTNNTDTTTSTILNTYTGATTSNIYIWGADLRVSNAGVNLPVYQRVGAATYGVTNPSVVIGNPDYDTTGFPMYLRFDGTDDSMATGTINPGAVDKAQVFAGMRNLLVSTAVNYSCVVEYSANLQTNNGVFSLFAPDGLGGIGYDYSWSSKGTSASPARVQTPNYVAPRTTVTSGLGDVSGDSSILRLNGAQVSQSTTDQGTGNFGAYPLYIGRRGGSTLPFNGNLYSLIVRFSATNLPDATIAQTETWVNGKTYAYGPPVPSTANNLIWATGNNLIWGSGNNITWGNS